MKVFRVNSWSHICIEGICMCNVDYDTKSSKWVYKLKKIKKNKPLKWEKEPNPKYDPNARPDEKPSHCKGYVCMECLDDGSDAGMCPHFAYCGIEKKVKKKFRKMIRKIYNG
jgi:hypothetical protein